jgi:hypothetical protein
MAEPAKEAPAKAKEAPALTAYAASIGVPVDYVVGIVKNFMEIMEDNIVVILSVAGSRAYHKDILATTLLTICHQQIREDFAPAFGHP